VTVFRWLLSHDLQNIPIESRCRFFEAFLYHEIEEGKGNRYLELLWKYYEKSGNYVSAAGCLLTMGTKTGQGRTSITQRITYLSHALMCIQSAPQTKANLEMKTQIQDYLDVAQVQLKTRFAIERRAGDSIESRLAAGKAASAEERAPATDTPSATVLRLRRSVRFWRGIAVTAGALAAVLMLFVVANALWPGIVVPHPYGQEYVAVVNRGGDLPALILRVDTRKGIVNVRTLGAEAPPGRSLELWYIAAGKAPKSLGVVENAPEPIVIPAVLRDGVADATIAVTAEPIGGSPTGGPPARSSIRAS